MLEPVQGVTGIWKIWKSKTSQIWECLRLSKQKLRNFYDVVKCDIIYCFIDHLFQHGR